MCVFHTSYSLISFFDSGHPGVWVPWPSVPHTERLQWNVPGLRHLRPRRDDFLAHQLSCLFPCEFNQWIRNSWMMPRHKINMKGNVENVIRTDYMYFSGIHRDIYFTLDKSQGEVVSSTWVWMINIVKKFWKTNYTVLSKISTL